ncbi:MAG: hypothetical protein CL981_00550 [Euryarchaeota archaeon]|nr:hypothetical protein [Euryarchaeota archaeon]|tara:strand:- start:439 stop:825 length:387 start_codon:yes stop_codon:yes gene_type:complete
MTSPIKFIKSLKKVEDYLWVYTPGMYNDALYRMWIRFDPSKNICRVHTRYTPDDIEADVLTDSYGIYQACTDILQWFWGVTDYENDPARLASLEDCRASGIGAMPEFVIHPKYTDVWRDAEKTITAGV